MVLTPKFSLSQSPAHLFVHITIPNVRVSGMELTVINSNDFSFYCRPYLLRLSLPGSVHDEEDLDESKRPRAQYDPLKDHGTVTVQLTKVNLGELFDGLDMLTSLLKVGAVRPRIGKGRYGLGVDGAGRYGFANGFEDFFGEDGFLEEFPDLIDLPHPDETSPEGRKLMREMHEDAMFSAERYRADLFHGKEDDLYQMISNYEPEWSIELKAERLKAKLGALQITSSPSKSESSKSIATASPSFGIFSSASTPSTSLTAPFAFGSPPATQSESRTAQQPFLFGSPSQTPTNQPFTFGTLSLGQPAPSSSQPPFVFGSPSSSATTQPETFVFGSPLSGEPVKLAPSSTPSSSTTLEESHGQAASSATTPIVADSFFNEKETRQLSLLTPKSFDPEATKNAFLKVIDVLLAFCYENRMCNGDFSVESHWTIRKLSATLSWLEDFQSLEDVFRSFARRCLCFPYLRRWDLCCLAARDCRDLLEDRRWVLRALFKVQDLLAKSQTAYLLNKLYIDDMCIWIQLPENRGLIRDQSMAAMKEMATVFDISKRVPGLELVGWNLAKASSSRRIAPEVLATSHLLTAIGNSATKTLSGGATAPIVVAGQERNVIEELD